MNPIERKKKQYQLDALRARKAKADVLGPEIIARTQATYDGICTEIKQLEQELAADVYDPVSALTQLMLEISQWPWPGEEQWAAYKRVRPDLSQIVDMIGKQLTDAYNGGRIPEYRRLLQKYREAWQALNRYVNEPPTQQNFLEGWTPYNAKDPWKK